MVAEVLLSQGVTVREASKQLRIVADLSLDNTILKEVLGNNLIADARIGTRQQVPGNPTCYRGFGCI